MIQNINLFVSALGGILVMSFLLMFLPAIIELKKPKDAGPRVITTSSFLKLRLVNWFTLLNIEGNYQEENQPGKTGISDSTGILQNLEA